MLQIKQQLVGRMNNAIVKQYPELEDLEIDPMLVEQNFVSDKYGYKNIKVKKIETEDIDATPSLETQKYEGLYRNVTINKIEGEEASLTPSTETQTKAGVFTVVTIPGEENYLEENIRTGISMWGKVGTMQGKGEENTVLKNPNVTGFMLTKWIREINDLDLTGVNALGYGAFNNCEYLEKISFKISTTTTIAQAFSSMGKLSEITLSKTSSVTSVQRTFEFSQALKKVYFEDGSSLKDLVDVFCYTSALEEFNGFINLGKAYTEQTSNYMYYKLDLSSCTKLTHESLMNVINGLYDLNLTYNVAGGGTLYTQQLVLGSTNISKLSAEELQICTEKGWIVS